MIAAEELTGAFHHRFRRIATTACVSPGRVNLVGEHTDYHGGWVLPVAINLGTSFLAAPREDAALRIYSQSVGEHTEYSLHDLQESEAKGSWGDYCLGVAQAMLPHADAATGLDIYIASDLPRSSGLSSSASLTVGTAFLLDKLWDCNATPELLVDVAQQAENDFVGVGCGILDPFAVCMGKSKHALALRCADRNWRYVEFPTSQYSLVVLPSGVTRELKDSAYNDRREESGMALARIRAQCDRHHSWEITAKDLDCLRGEHLLHSRALHFFSENRRVEQAVRALEADDLNRFGAIMTESHRSLRDDYDVSCPELDRLVGAANEHGACLGAKMSGAGFGGAATALVESAMIHEFIDHMEGSGAIASASDIVICQVAGGVQEIFLS